MSYALRYNAEFDSFVSPWSYEVLIYKKNYIGDPEELKLAADPVIQEWQDDDPKAPVKGCTLTVNLLSDSDDTYNLDSFYSEDDYMFKVEFNCTTTGTLLFTGWLIQDDCSEIMVDYMHGIKLLFTDGLGVLKDIRLDQAAVNLGPATTETAVAFSAGVPKVINISNGVPLNPFNVQPGQTFTINGGGLAGTWTVVANLGALPLTGWAIQVAEDVPATGVYIDSFTYTTPIPLEGYVPLTTILRLCLGSTNLGINSKVLTALAPTGGTTGRLFEDTYVQATTFIKGNEWMTCYAALEAIMARFRMSVSQNYGLWTFIRWGEIWDHYTAQGSTYPCQNYDDTFTHLSNTTYTNDFNFLDFIDHEVGVVKSLVRPYRYVKETFNYNRTEDFIRNQALDQLGPLVDVQTVGAETWYDYELKYWTAYDGSTGPDAARLIRVIRDANGDEIDRFAVIIGPTFDNPRAAQSADIYVPKNSVIKYSFDWRTNISQPGAFNAVFALRIRDNSTSLYLKDNGTFAAPVGFTYSVLAGDDTNQWHTVEIESVPVPFNCMVSVFLGVETLASPTDETHYRNLKMEVINPVDAQGYVIGHTHTKSQSKEIKNISESEITMDTSPVLGFSGVLYLDTTTGIFQDPTTTWGYPSLANPFPNLGSLTTSEELFSRRFPTQKYNGIYRRINSSIILNRLLSNVATLRLWNLPTQKRFAPGSLSINYKDHEANFTFWEVLSIDNSGTVEQQFGNFDEDNLYQFQYLYDKK